MPRLTANPGTGSKRSESSSYCHVLGEDIMVCTVRIISRKSRHDKFEQATAAEGVPNPSCSPVEVRTLEFVHNGCRPSPAM